MPNIAGQFWYGLQNIAVECGIDVLAAHIYPDWQQAVAFPEGCWSAHWRTRLLRRFLEERTITTVMRLPFSNVPPQAPRLINISTVATVRHRGRGLCMLLHCPTDPPRPQTTPRSSICSGIQIMVGLLLFWMETPAPTLYCSFISHNQIFELYSRQL